MSLGTFQHSLDAKGRITIPAKLRDVLGETFVATQGLDNCIFLYPMPEWQVVEKKICGLPMSRPEARSFQRFFLSGASEMEIDKQGRVVLPSNLRVFAGIEKDIVIIGVGSRIEIWAAEKWAGYNQKAADSYEEMAVGLVDLGI